MPDNTTHDDAIETAARDLVAELGRIRRRKAPRIAPALTEAAYAMAPTGLGGVATWRTLPSSPGAPTVLLVHGWEDDNSLWQPLLEQLGDALIPAVAMDLPGHGLSEGNRLDLIGGGAALANVIATVGPIDAVVTHSFGGPLLVEAIEHHGLRPQRCVLIAPPLSQLEQYRRLSARHGIPERVVERAIALIDAETGRPMAENDLRRAAPAMPGPALFIHSDDDQQCPVEASHTLAELWPGGRKLILDGLGHREIARAPGVVARIIDFILQEG